LTTLHFINMYQQKKKLFTFTDRLVETMSTIQPCAKANKTCFRLTCQQYQQL